MPPSAGDDRPLSALPSSRARGAAFAAILIGGVCGAVIGSSVAGPLVGCRSGCTTASGIGGLVGAIACAVGVGIVAVLTLRAMAEWKRVDEDDLFSD